MPYIDTKQYGKPKAEKKQRAVTDKRKIRQSIYNTPQWKKLRKAYLMEHPLCERCLEKDIISVAEQIHHKDSFMKHLDSDGNVSNETLTYAYDYNNLQSLCRKCHEEIHHKEQNEKRVLKNDPLKY